MLSCSETQVPISRHRTAISRYELSRPLKLALQSGLISVETTVLDYGCGLGGDVRLLAAHGIPCTGWDPFYLPAGARAPSDVVNLGFVVNVVEDPSERLSVLRDAWKLAKTLLIV